MSVLFLYHFQDQNTVSISTNDTIDNPDVFEVTCPKCQQVFYMKTNWEIHTLFCGKEDQPDGDQSIQEEEQQKQKHLVIDSGSFEVSAVHQISTEATMAVASIKDDSEEVTIAPQSYKLIPLGEADDSCVSCNKRTPLAGTNCMVDMDTLLFNATKKIINEDLEVFECQECNRDFLCKHPVGNTPAVNRRKIERPHSCSICTRSFESLDEMYLHELKHSHTNRRYSCPKCQMKFTTRSSLQDHYNTSKDGCAPRRCAICAKEFVHANHLRRHMSSVHAGIKPFSCVVCSREFNQKSDLQRHERRHTVKGRLSCNICSLLYDNVDELKAHYKTHQKELDEKGELRHKCDQCLKTFKRKSHYTRHLSIHQGIRPYECDECGKAFNQKSDLRRHEEMHTRKKLKLEQGPATEEQYICEICPRVFPQQAILDAHNAVMHSSQNETSVFQ